MEPGTILAGRYRLDRVLGSGGMGEVWQGHDLDLGRNVAVKLIKDAESDHVVLLRFRREAAIAAGLQHSGITVVHDAGRHGGRLFMVTELLRGQDLAALLATHPDGLPVSQVLDLGIQLTDALAAAHGQGIVHRDLKPSNLFLQADDKLKILDFGIARDLNTASTITKPGDVFGTPPYMAPEQWIGGPATASIDLYAVGCILYEMLTGRPPFDGPILAAYMTQHLSVTPVPPRDRNASVPAALNDLVVALLSKDAGYRPPGAAAVLAALTQIRDRGRRDSGATIHRSATVRAGAPQASPIACAWGKSFYVLTADGGSLCLRACDPDHDAWGVPSLLRGSPRGQVTAVAAVTWPGAAQPTVAFVADGVPYVSHLASPPLNLCPAGDTIPLRLPAVKVALSRRQSGDGINVYVLDSADRLWARTRGDADWYPWRETESPVTGRVTAITVDPSHGVLDVVATADGRVCHRSGPLSPATTDVDRRIVDVAYSSVRAMHSCVFALDDAGTIAQLWDWWNEDGLKRSEWTVIPGPSGLVTGIAADKLGDGRGILLASTANGEIHRARWTLRPPGQPDWSGWSSM
jgi:Protein kinase domain